MYAAQAIEAFDQFSAASTAQAASNSVKRPR
jgi:hypothetical protein